MKPESADYMHKARALLDEAQVAYSVPMIDHAGRAAYLAGFHAAQAWLFENLGSIPKTHSGVQGQFAKLVKDIPTFVDEDRAFLGRTYNLKAIADYETGPTPMSRLNRRRRQSQPHGASSLP